MANYEADFLLKNRDKTRSEKKSYEASKFEEKAVYLSLLSDVATVYTNILEYDELILLAQEKTNIYAEILKRDTKKFERGTISTSELNNSAKNLEATKNELEKLQKEQEILLMQLAVLTGKSADCISDLSRGKFENFEYQGTIPDEINSDVIYSRPDVMQAEKRLEKAKIDIRVARKEFLPTFNITGLWIFNTIAPGTFFSWKSSLAAILAGASQDIFTGGRKIANLKIQKAKYEELFEKYRQTDLEAVKEVNTALCFIKHDTIVDNNTLAKVQYELKNLENSRKKYARGTISAPEYQSVQDQKSEDLPLGFKQRLSLACALIHNPPILFLDEPTSGVDVIARREFWNHITSLAKKGVTILVTTHFMDEAEFCDRISLFYKGEAIAVGTPKELKQKANESTMEDTFITLIKESEK